MILFTSCSFDNKSGIWSGSEKEKRRISELEEEQKRVLNTIKIYTSETFFSKEIPGDKNVNLTKPKTNSSWKMSGLNPQNFVGNRYLSGIGNNFLKKRVGKNKFSILQFMSSPLVFNNNIFLQMILVQFSASIKEEKSIGKKIFTKRHIRKYIKIYLFQFIKIKFILPITLGLSTQLVRKVVSLFG